MAQGSQLEHRYLDVTSLEYRTYNSPTSTDPVWQNGENAMVSQKGYIECRPGFSQVVAPPPTGGYAGTIERIFTWRRWGGSYFVMVCSTSNVRSYVYKYEVGVDVRAVLLFTSNNNTPFDFIVSNNTCYFGNGVDMQKFEGSGSTVYAWQFAAPPTPTVTQSAGTLSAIAGGFYYWQTYVRESTNGESSPSGASVCTGNFTNQKNTIQGTLSSDPQVSHVYTYRSTDGGAAIPQDSLFVTKTANVVGGGTFTVDDELLDTSLGSRQAPADQRNNPPTPCKGFVTHSGRIFGFNNNKVYYSGFEEISFNGGVPEECWPGGADGNFRPYAAEVTSLGSVIDGVVINLASDQHEIEGDSLDTFRFYKLASHQGTRNTRAIDSFGGMTIWFDSSSSVWLSGGNELSLPIRDTIAVVDSTRAQLTIHMQNSFRWVTVLDPARRTLYVMDTDMQKWFVPWTFGADVTAVASGETAPGVFNLMLAIDGNVVAMTPGLSTDFYGGEQNDFRSSARTNLFDIVPGVAYGAYQRYTDNIVLNSNPSVVGYVDHISVERNQEAVVDCRLMLDDDTDATASYKSIVGNRVDAPRRVQGSLLKEDWFFASTDIQNHLARRASLELTFASGPWKWYSVAVAYKAYGG